MAELTSYEKTTLEVLKGFISREGKESVSRSGHLLIKKLEKKQQSEK
jgi:hypothetical protein